jgi:phospholipid/cholesterol/gamma-HCH transport system ATP-binding protein
MLSLTVIMVTHDLDTIFALATQIAVLSDKRVIAKGTPDEVVAVKHPFIEEYFMGARGLRAQQALTKNL